ncbi:FAD-binding domain-containing protein [Hymenopellis radicata]|nr:FAD-binding domain-containing protein [Hymenopellis radicata]
MMTSSTPLVPIGFKGDWITPSHPDYSSAISRWAVSSERRAKVVAFVKDEEDVVLAITYSRNEALQWVVCGGGHSPNGASSSEGGVVIDVSRYMNQVRVDPERMLAHVGGGTRGGVIDECCSRYGLAAVGGTFRQIGIGGLILVGGYGWQTPAHGLSTDSVIEATVVTRDGTVLTASKTENPDMFSKLRVLGPKIGVCTAFSLKLYPQRHTVYAGMLLLPFAEMQSLTEVTDRWWNREPSAAEGMIQVLSVDDMKPVIRVFLFYNGSESEGRRVYRDFLKLNLLADETREMSYQEANMMQDNLAPSGFSVYRKGLVRPAMSYRAIHEATEIMNRLSLEPDGFRPTIFFEFFPAPKANTPIDSRRSASLTTLLNVMWDVGDGDDGDSQTQRVREAVGQAISILELETGPSRM